ncbi:hypothetical protein CPB85DRAFT_285268 [Mucidula mucida]|nr:hypothetical protein CPB85DRAFT_285268 [Mucidula mucida]
MASMASDCLTAISARPAIFLVFIGLPSSVPRVKLYCILLQRFWVSHFGLPILPRSFQLDMFRAAAALDLPTLKGALDDPHIGIHLIRTIRRTHFTYSGEEMQLRFPNLMGSSSSRPLLSSLNPRLSKNSESHVLVLETTFIFSLIVCIKVGIFTALLHQTTFLPIGRAPSKVVRL